MRNNLMLRQVITRSPYSSKCLFFLFLFLISKKGNISLISIKILQERGNNLVCWSSLIFDCTSITGSSSKSEHYMKHTFNQKKPQVKQRENIKPINEADRLRAPKSLVLITCKPRHINMKMQQRIIEFLLPSSGKTWGYATWISKAEDYQKSFLEMH